MKNRYATILKSSAVALACGALFSLNAHAATYIWDGGGANGNWSTAANWNPDGAPNPDGDTLRSQSLFMNITESLPVTGTTAVFAGGQSATLSGAITGAGTLNVGGTGSGQVANNRFNFAANVLNGFTGTLHLDSTENYIDLRAQNAPNVKLMTSGASSGQYVRMWGNNTYGELSGTSGYIRGDDGYLILNQNTDTTYGGRLDEINSNNEMGLTKNGTGTLRLTGTNNRYEWATTVNGGALLVDGSLVQTPVVVNSTATLGGSGAVGSNVTINNGGTLQPTAGEEFTISGTVTGAGTGNIDFNGGTLTATGPVAWAGAGVSVGSGSTLNLSNASSVFTSGLTIADGGTLGAGSNFVGAPTISGAGNFTLSDGAILNYSINSDAPSQDLFTITSDHFFGLSDDVTLEIDVLAGAVSFADSFDIISFTGTGDAPDFANWTVVGAPGTRLGQTGTFSWDGTTLSLTGLEAFAIPEPSTAMLLGMGAVVMILRRRIRR